MSITARMLVNLVGLVFMLCACFAVRTSEAAGSEACARQLSDEDVEKLVATKINLSYVHKTYLKYIECTNYFTIYEIPSPPDSELRGFVDGEGNVYFSERFRESTHNDR